MDIVQYFSKINQSCQDVFEETLKNPGELGIVHDLSSSLYEWAEAIENGEEKKLLENVGNQIEVSALNLATGLYRQAFYSLRLSLELLLATIYFSVNKLDYMEWINGNGDIYWSKLKDENNGVLSKRFAKAFFPELVENVEEYSTKTVTLYRKLSEYVHGNYETWQKEGPTIIQDKQLFEQYLAYIDTLKDISTFFLICRYLKTIPSDKFDSISENCNSLKHIESIRCFLGGPKEN